MNEAETRAEYIDPALKNSGWGIISTSLIRREFKITEGRILGAGKKGEMLSADYMLEYRGSRLAVIEAKALNKPDTAGVAQAKDYATRLGIRFAYSSNGKRIYSIDMHTGKEAYIEQYPSPEELWNATYGKPNLWRDKFASIPFKEKAQWNIRYYQACAVTKTLEAIADNHKRILLTLATGTGKTSIAFQISWKLFEARWNLAKDEKRRPRILFLADRNTLANQSYNDFDSFMAFATDAFIRITPHEIRKKGYVPNNANVFFTIFQTFMTGTDENNNPKPYFGEYPVDFFDCIIIDECHRGGASDESSWRDILNHFSEAVQIGLTATPKRKNNIDTYEYFGDPVYVYSLKDGISDGFLTPFKIRQFTSNIDEYVYSVDDDVLEGKDLLKEAQLFKEKDFNNKIIMEARELHRVKSFLVELVPNEKTLVFCANQAHALLIRDLINQNKQNPHPDYCVRVTANDGIIGDQFLASFQDNEKIIPVILTTSQKLTTGVDARNVRNIVLLRPVKDMIEFKQIIGRGTRIFEGKDYFTIYDFVKDHEHFKDSEWDGEPENPDTSTGGSGKPLVAGGTTGEPKTVIKIKLANGKEHFINTTSTSFIGADGKIFSLNEFLSSLYIVLPEFFKDEETLLGIWSNPSLRKKLLDGLAEKGFGLRILEELYLALDAEMANKSDLFDLLAFISYSSPIKSRKYRANKALKYIEQHCTAKQKDFFSFVIKQYIKEGVKELAEDKLATLLKICYNDSIADAIAELGNIEEIRSIFIALQKELYC